MHAAAFRVVYRNRHVFLPVLTLLVGILMGTSWVSVFQLQRSPSPYQPEMSPVLNQPSAPIQDRSPRMAPTVHTSGLTAAAMADRVDDSREEGNAALWDPENVDADYGIAALGNILISGAVAGSIPTQPLNPSRKPTPIDRYAKSAADIAAALQMRQAEPILHAAPAGGAVIAAKRPFRFHVYDIPEQYTTGALKLLEERWPTSFCNRHKVKTNYTMLDWRHAFSLFTADVFITKYLRYHPAHTENPNEADVFIIPMMTHVYHCAGVNHYTIEIISWLMQFQHYKQYHQHDHFLFWWRWGMHFNSVNKFWRRVTRFIPNVNLMSFDYLEIMGRNDFQDFSLALKPRFLQTQHHIVMPYPDFSPELSVPAALDDAVRPKKKIFFYFAGTSTIGGIRRWIKRNCHAAADPSLCYYEDFAKNVIDSTRLGIPKGYPAAMKNSLFCGHAAGDALSSRRPTSAILANCIPVLICDLCLYAFENLIDYNSFAVFLSEDDVIQGKMLEKLQAIPPEKVESMQRNLLLVRRHFVYNTTSAPQPGDALDMLVRQLSLRGSILRQYRRWFTTNAHLSDNPKEYPVVPPVVKRYLMRGNSAEERDFNALG